MNITTKLAVTGALASVFALTGCGSDNPYEGKVTVSGDNNMFKAETLARGDFFSSLPAGLHRITISKEITGEEKDTECFVLKDRVGHGAYAAMSCK